MKKLNILVIGGGMYVTGRGTNGYGTILPSLLNARSNGIVDNIAIATTSSKSVSIAKKTVNKLSKIMNTWNQCEYFPINRKVDTNSYKKALEEFDPDAVIISVPDHLHKKITIDVLKKKKHCLLVKPMTSNLKDGYKMLAAANKAKVVAEVEFHKRLDESNILLRDKFKRNELGDLLYATIEYSQRKIIPEKIFKKWSDKTNVFSYLAVHYVDLIYFITGYLPISVVAFGQKNYLKSKGINTWDAIQVIVEWKKSSKEKFISTHVTNWIDSNKSSAMSDQKINFVGTKGRFQADQKNRGIEFISVDGAESINPYFSSSFSDNLTNNMIFKGYGISNISEFLNDVVRFNSKKITLNQLDQSRPTFRSSLVSTAVIDAVNKSLSENSKIIKVNL